MSEWDEREIERPQEGGPPPRRSWVLWAIAAVAVAGIGIYLYLFYWKSPPPSPAIEPPASPEPGERLEEREPKPAVELSSLAESDRLVRELVGKLSAHPKLASWLLGEDLIRRFTAFVDNIAEGLSPRTHLSFLEPGEDFRVVHKRGRIYIDRRSYERYNTVADVFDSLDGRGAAELYRALKPLIQEAYLQMGYAQRDFDDTLSRAIRHLLATPALEGDVELNWTSVSYEFADPRLERLSAAQKHLLRMGPRNVRKIQGKLLELAAALGISSKP